MALTPKACRNEVLGKTLVERFEQRNFAAYYCSTIAEAREKVLSLLPENSSVAWGGSMTIRDMGLTDAIQEGKYQVIDRELAGKEEEKFALSRQGFFADYYLMSANAVAEEGILVNIDKTGNRVAALCFGPKHVIVVCGCNKVEQNLQSAIARARFVAAPTNATRFGLEGKLPCLKTGTCHNCKAVDSICANLLLTRFCKPAKRIQIVFVGENLGY